MATPHDFCRAFSLATKFEIVGAPKENERQLRFIGRVPTRAISRVWAHLYVKALTRASNERWSVDVSRYYFVRGDDVIWAWRIIIQATTIPLAQALDEVLHELQLVRHRAEVPTTTELAEIPLVAASTTRNLIINGKGASNVAKERA